MHIGEGVFEPGLPCCPHCGSVLFQIEAPKWFAGADRYEREGRDGTPHPGYRDMIDWQRGKCFPSGQSAADAYQAETGRKVTI